MEITVTNGQNIIKILADDFASCLVIEKPLIVNWYDCRGSIGQYFAVSNYSTEERDSITAFINDKMIDGSEEEIFTVINTFLHLFEDGTYKVSLLNLELDCSIFYYNMSTKYADHVPENERFSGALYPSMSRYEYFYTIPHGRINEERVTYYMDLINSGKQPKAVIFTIDSLSQNEFMAAYVLDGHHKIEAYHRLGKEINVVYISKKVTDVTKPGEIIALAHSILKPHEYMHFFIHHRKDMESIDFTNNPVMTKFLDDILLSHNEIPTKIFTLFRNYNKPDNPEKKVWLEQRITNLGRNKYIGKGLILYFINSENKIWYPMEIKNRFDYKNWLDILYKS